MSAVSINMISSMILSINYKVSIYLKITVGQWIPPSRLERL